MKAIRRDKYGPPDVLELKDIERPVAKDGEVLVRVRAASLNQADLDYLLGKPFLTRMGTGLRTPRNSGLGLDVAGHVEAVGRAVTTFQPGDEVFGDLTAFGYGAFAEYACAPEDAWALKPASLSLEEAATIPQAAILALQGLGRGERIGSGTSVIVNGASGNVGPFAIQIAKAFGAHVTGVCSTAKMDMVRELGADEVIDYTREDYTRSGQRYDWIIDVAGNRSILECRRALRPRGRLRHGRRPHDSHLQCPAARPADLAGWEPEDGPHVVVEGLQEGRRGPSEGSRPSREDQPGHRPEISAGGRT